MTNPVPCGLRDIDLRAPFPAIAAETGEQSVLVYFWQDGVPVGRRLFLETDLPVPASALPSLAAATSARTVAKLAEDAKDHEASVSAADISVVVCTRDRPDQLQRCIAAVSACDPSPREIIVVDNSETPGRLSDVLAGFPAVRIVDEPRKGLSIARNTGLAAATGSIVAFTDDDVEVPVNWVGTVAGFFGDPRVGAVTGPVLPAQLRSDAEFAFEMEIGGLASSLVPKDFDNAFLNSGFWKAPHVWEIGAGANMSIRKSATDEVGAFDERLGAGAAGCSEDSEFMYRLLRAGWTCRYRPEVYVRHHHRANDTDLRKQMRAYMRGHVAALLVQFAETRDPGNLARVLIGLPRYYLGWIVIRIAALVGIGWIEPWGRAARATRFQQVRGSVEGLLFLLRHRGQPKFSTTETKPDA